MKAIVDFKLNVNTMLKYQYDLMSKASIKRFLDVENFELSKYGELIFISSNFESIVINNSNFSEDIHIRETAKKYNCFKKKDIITSNNENIIHLREEIGVNNILHYKEKEKIIISSIDEKEIQEKMFKLRNRLK